MAISPPNSIPVEVPYERPIKGRQFLARMDMLGLYDPSLMGVRRGHIRQAAADTFVVGGAEALRTAMGHSGDTSRIDESDLESVEKKECKHWLDTLAQRVHLKATDAQKAAHATQAAQEAMGALDSALAGWRDIAQAGGFYGLQKLVGSAAQAVKRVLKRDVLLHLSDESVAAIEAALARYRAHPQTANSTAQMSNTLKLHSALEHFGFDEGYLNNVSGYLDGHSVDLPVPTHA